MPYFERITCKSAQEKHTLKSDNKGRAGKLAPHKLKISKLIRIPTQVMIKAFKINNE